MLIKTLTVGNFQTNCYIVTDKNSLDCAVIDPGEESKKIMNYLESNKLNCKAIILTHAHFDHTGALESVKEQTGATVYMSKNEMGLCVGLSNIGFKAPEDAVFVKDGDQISVGELVLKVIETPGHTPGGICLVCGKALFTGDTLFRGSCGRTDFPGGDMLQQMNSLKKLGELPGDYDVYPGHAESSTMTFERSQNPYMRRAIEGF